MLPADAWAAIQAATVEADATLSVAGYDRRPSNAGARRLSEGSVAFRTAREPVGDAIFYRDVPLMPVRTHQGIVRPLRPEALPLIEWRLRDITRPAPSVVMSNLPTCANCHSFSADG